MGPGTNIAEAATHLSMIAMISAPRVLTSSAMFLPEEFLMAGEEWSLSY